MAWVQDTRIPVREREEFTLKNFTGGLNNRSNMIEDNEASDLLNMAFAYEDVMEKRHGFTSYDDLTLPEPITFLGVFKPYNDVDQLIRATNSEVYANNTKIADVQGEIDGVNFQGNFFFADGNDLYVYGHFTNVTGIYTEIRGTYIDDYCVLKVVNPEEGYTPLDEVHARGKTVYDYDTMTVWYEPCEHELNDVYLGFNVLPEHPRFIEVRKSRLFVSGDKKDDDNVFISDVNLPYYFAVALPIQLPPNSDEVTGMTIYDDALIVGRKKDMYKIVGETNNPELGFDLFQLVKLNTHTGVANNRAWDIAHNFLFFLGSDGNAYAIGTTHMDSRLVTTTIISKQIDVFKYPISVTQDDIYDASSAFYNDEWYVNIGDKTLVYSYVHRAWTMYDYVNMLSPLIFEDELIWGRHDGKVYKFGTEYTDNGRPILAFWKSKVYDFGSATRYKQFREFFIVAETYDFNDSDIRVSFEVDYADVYGVAEVKNKLSIWGKSKFGDRFITRNINASIPFMVGRRARNFRIQFANGYRVDNYVETEQDLYDIPKKYNYMGAYVNATDAYYYYKQGEWIKLDMMEINQPMCVFQVNGEYEYRGKR